MVSGQNGHQFNKMSPVHNSVKDLPKNVVKLLLAIHTLPGYDITSKVGTKLQAFKAAHKPEYALFNVFGISALNGRMYEIAEHFLSV